MKMMKSFEDFMTGVIARQDVMISFEIITSEESQFLNWLSSATIVTEEFVFFISTAEWGRGRDPIFTTNKRWL